MEDKIPLIPLKKQEKTKQALVANDAKVMVYNSNKKNRAEEKAWRALDTMLETRRTQCVKCDGEGTTASGKPCATCNGEGVLLKTPEASMVKMVLEPKFPKVSLDIRAEVDNMSVEDLFNVIQEM